MTSTLEPPPEDPAALGGFPRIQLRGRGLYRLFRHRDPATGRPRQPFFFASAPEGGGGRYDLPSPDGACYLARSRAGAWLETFRSTYLARADLRRYRLLATRPPYSLRAADLLDPAGRAYGVTGEIHVTTDYRLTRRWAERLHQAGVRALHGKVRHDPALEERSVTLLNEAGEHLPYGWRWWTQVSRLLDEEELIGEVARRYGYQILAVPYDVETRPAGPPDRGSGPARRQGGLDE